MRICLNKFYVIESAPGISGFQRWGEREYRVIMGHKARNNRASIVAEWTPQDDEKYSIEDGRCPEYQQHAHPADVVAWFAQGNEYQCALATGKAHDRLVARHNQPL